MAVTVRETPSIPRILVAGLIASIVMGMWEMVVEQLIGNGFWAPVVYIAATVVRSLQQVAAPVPFDLVGVVLGLMGHMMNSVILGVIFALIVSRFATSVLPTVLSGMVYGVIIFAIMWFGVLPAINPVMLHLNAPVFLIGHLMWGVALGLVLAWGRVTHALTIKTA